MTTRSKSLVIAVLLSLSLMGCSGMDRRNREHFRGYVSNEMMEQPHKHRCKWAFARFLYWVGAAAFPVKFLSSG